MSATCQHQRGNHKALLHLLAASSLSLTFLGFTKHTRGADMLLWGVGAGRQMGCCRAAVKGGGAGRQTGRGCAAMGEGAGRRHAGLVMGVRAVCLAQAVRGRVGREGEPCCLAHAVGAVEHAVVEVDVDELRTVLHLPKESGERSEKGAGKGESSACLFKPKGV